MEKETNHIRRRFGHSIIRWEIEHFCLLSCEANCSIETKQFFIKGPQLTEWRLYCVFNVNINGNSSFNVVLKRENLEDPGTVQVNWLLYLIQENKDFFIEEGVKEFTGGSEYSIGNYKHVDFLTKIRPFDNDQLTLRCQLLVTKERDIEDPDVFNDGSLKSLSQDLTLLYTGSNNCNITLKVGENIIAAHKAILISRNDILAKMISENLEKEVIDLSQMDYEAMKAIIEYFYSGSIEPLLKKPSIAIYKCVIFFNIKELLRHFMPDEVIHSTVGIIDEFSHTWTISDFSRRDCVLETPILNKGDSLTTWQFKLYPNYSSDPANRIAFSAETIHLAEQQAVCIEFAVIGDNQEVFFPKRIVKFLTTKETFAAEDFASKKDFAIDPIIKQDVLTVLVKIRMSLSSRFTTLLPVNSLFYATNGKYETYKLLSVNVGTLAESSEFSDITVAAEKEHFRLHKCILSARSSFFSRIINERGETEELLHVSDIGDDFVFSVVVNYIYCGTLKKIELKYLTLVYEAAKYLDISSLKDACFSAIRKKIAAKNVGDILAFADEKHDTELKNAVFNYIPRHLDEVSKQVNWVDLTQTKPALMSELKEYMKLPS